MYLTPVFFFPSHGILLKITYIDFVVYELLDHNSQLIPGILDEFPNLKEFHARIGGLEKVAAYLSSDKCIKNPFNGPIGAFWGKWGGK
jgi:glutathione S-transferase